MTDDEDILKHLFNIEAEAAALVRDAQEEADRRIREGERKAKAAHDERCAREGAALEEEYRKGVEAAKGRYALQVEAYRKELEAAQVDYAAFAEKAGGFLLRKG